MSLSLSPSPDRTYNRLPLNDTTGVVKEREKKTREKPKPASPEPKKELDPILEARRRKFENPVPLEGNGIIKLNLKKEKSPTQSPVEENIDEIEQTDENLNQDDDIDDLLDLNPSIDDLWSEEESDNENEGRFKVQTTQKRTVTCLPFSKLTEKQTKPVLTTKNDRNPRFDRKRNREREADRPKREPKEPRVERVEKIDIKTRVKVDKNNGKMEEKVKIVEKVKEEKIEEIKPKEVRKVEIPKEIKEVPKPVEESLDDEDDTEIIIEFDDDDEEDEKEFKDDSK